MLEPVMTYQLVLPEGTDALLILPKLKMLEEEEPQLHIVWNELLKQIHVQIMGAVQIEILQNLIKDRFGIEVGSHQAALCTKKQLKTLLKGSVILNL